VGKVKLNCLANRSQLNQPPVAGKSMSKMLLKSSTTALVSLDEGNCSTRKGRSLGGNALFVPVVSAVGSPLMPCHPARARELVRKGRAIRRFSKGIFYVKLLDRQEGDVQSIAVGIDPGSKKEGFTVKSAEHTYLNIQADAVTWVKDAVETKRIMRRNRRQRKTPCRQNRMNRSRGCLPPSTKARWQWKLRIAKVLSNLFPVDCFVVEDIKAKTTEKRKWDVSFSPLETGKKWFYSALRNIGEVELKQRNQLGLKKSKNKLDNSFAAHCVDSWVLANSWVGGNTEPDNKNMLLIAPIQLHRRQLHVLQPNKGGIRKPYGSTRSLGFKRGSLVNHPKYGICYVGGTSNNRVSLHSQVTGKRFCQKAKVEDCRFLTYNSWRIGNSSAA
jgi:hypothetical protein